MLMLGRLSAGLISWYDIDKLKALNGDIMRDRTKALSARVRVWYITKGFEKSFDLTSYPDHVCSTVYITPYLDSHNPMAALLTVIFTNITILTKFDCD
jgi:dolichyl-phosphate-mannose--protein O-mannosyl transferase